MRRVMLWGLTLMVLSTSLACSGPTPGLGRTAVPPSPASRPGAQTSGSDAAVVPPTPVADKELPSPEATAGQTSGRAEGRKAQTPTVSWQSPEDQDAKDMQGDNEEENLTGVQGGEEQVPEPAPAPIEPVSPRPQSPVVAIRPPASPYGVNDWNWTDAAMLAMKEAGITWMRVMVHWSQIEATQGVRVWNQGPNANIDFYMSQAQKYGMQVSASVYATPDWARQPGLVLPQADAFAGFVTSFLQRYPGKIGAVEVLNEENTAKWPETKNRDAMYYVPVLKEAYTAVKAVSPNTLVATSGLWGSPIGYMEDIYTLGGKGFFDVVNFHYYPGNQPPTRNFTWWASHLRDVMEKYGDGEKPVWLTEVAWTSTDENRPGATKDIVSPQEVIDNMAYVLDASRKSGFIDRVFWYDLRDDDGMALMHATDKYGWHTPQPLLAGEIQPASANLMVEGNWTTRWPQSGTLIVDQETIAYISLTSSGPNTRVQGLVRGVRGTTAASHGSGVAVINLDQTKDFKRQPFYTYGDFIQAYPSWGISDTGPLPDVTPPAAGSVKIRNPGFEDGKAGWSRDVTIDLKEKHTGSASAKAENTTGTWTRVFQPALPVEPERSYLLEAWVKIDPNGSGDMSAMVMADLNDSAGKFLSLVPGNYYVYDTAGAWRRIVYPFRTTAGATQMMPFLSTDKGTGVAWFDDISVEPYDLSAMP